jgi:hypothetical protein
LLLQSKPVTVLLLLSQMATTLLLLVLLLLFLLLCCLPLLLLPLPLLLPWQLLAAASWLPSWMPCHQPQELLTGSAVPPPPSGLLLQSLQGSGAWR